jgi:hypothetical protein
MSDEPKDYTSLLHAMQTGVAYVMEKEPSETSPKQLRVGVNSAMVENGALVSLLIEKGLITLEEWEAALTAMMTREVQMYEARVNQLYGSANGTRITLA